MGEQHFAATRHVLWVFRVFRAQETCPITVALNRLLISVKWNRSPVYFR